MSEIEFGSPEHIAGLSRKALEEDFLWAQARREELKGICERLDAENRWLRGRVEDLEEFVQEMGGYVDEGHWDYVSRRMDEMGCDWVGADDV